VGAVALILVAMFVGNIAREHGQGHVLSQRRYEDVYYLPPVEWLQTFSLGHREALAGMVWLNALIYFGEEIVHQGQVAHLYSYADAIIGLDPNFKRAYQWVATCALYRTGHITTEDAKRAVKYLERAVKRFPDDGELAWDLGSQYIYELVPMLDDKQAKAEARRRGVEHLRVAALRGAGPPWLALSAASEFSRLGQTEQQIRYLEEVYPQVDDPKIRHHIESKLARLRSEAHAEALRRTDAEVEAARRRDFPYLDTTLYLLVGARPPVAGRELLLRDFEPMAERFVDAEDDDAAARP
jgi:tetratricopeptide (TPR) repeat protein